VFRAVEAPAAVDKESIVVRLAVRDAVTSETGEMVKDVSVVYSVLGGETGKVKATFIGGDLFRAIIPAQKANAVVSLTPQATDRRNLKGYGATVTVRVKSLSEGSGGTGGTGGTAGSGGTATGGSINEPGAGGEPPGMVGGAGGEPPTTGGTDSGPEPSAGSGGEEPGTSGSSTGGTSATGGTSSSGGTSGNPSEGGVPGEGGVPSVGGSSPSSGSGDDGCSVSTTGTSSSGSGWLAALGLALMAGRRKRRSRGE
jgi:MYXO-CTERM domain-containing protein